jgi:PmbA protein
MIKDTSRLLGAKALKTGRYTAYIEPKAFAQLMGIFFFMLNAKTVMEGKSRLADKLEKKIASDKVTIIDDPMLEGGKANRPFDSEGTPAKKLSVIEKGVLKSFLHNSETAKALGQTNTGHASRSYSSTLGVAPSNFYLQTGDGVRFEDGVIVTELMGVHAGANPISGDISVQAFGLKVEKGEVVYPVENFALSSNLLDILMNVKNLGKELVWSPFAGMMGSPMVEIGDVSFGGA